MSVEKVPTGENHDETKHIPGIYNYCDRWCERCEFTSRCLNYEMSEKKFGDLEDANIHNEEFWQRFSETLHETLVMVKEMAAERGIDLESIELEDEDNVTKNFEDPSVVHLISSMAESYIRMVDEWFDSNIYIIGEDHLEVETAAASESITSGPDEKTISLFHAVEVIRWYQHQMYVKIRSAAHSALEDAEDNDSVDYPKYSDGAAKVALIGMDRSIGAWGKIIKHFPDGENSVLGIISHLDRLRRRTEVEFPEARSFVRPGFDE